MPTALPRRARERPGARMCPLIPSWPHRTAASTHLPLYCTALPAIRLWSVQLRLHCWRCTALSSPRTALPARAADTVPTCHHTALIHTPVSGGVPLMQRHGAYAVTRRAHLTPHQPRDRRRHGSNARPHRERSRLFVSSSSARVCARSNSFLLLPLPRGSDIAIQRAHPTRACVRTFVDDDSQ